jgi:hypothetical protein
MAQQTGGPISAGQFQEALAPYQQAFPSVQAGGLLNALGMAQAGSQQAQAFAGQVFPAMQTEQQAQVRNFYQDKINTAQDNIAQLESGKAGLVNDKYNTLLQNEQQYNLDQAKLKLDQTTAAHNWQMQKSALNAQILKNKILAGEYGLKAKSTAAQIAKTQADIVHMNNQDKLRAEQLGITAAHYQAMSAHYAASDKLATQRATSTSQKNAMSLIDAAMGTGKPVDITTKLPLSGLQLQGVKTAWLEGKRVPDTYYDKKTHTWYQYQTQHMTPQSWAQQQGVKGVTPVTDPNDLYNLLIGAGTPKSMAQSLVRIKTGLSGWSPGKTSSYTPSSLGQMTTDELRGIAIQRGFKAAGNMANVARQRLIDFISASGLGG